MMRSLGVILAVFCVATLLSQILGIVFLWHRGQLTAQTLGDIRMVLSGQEHFGSEAGLQEEDRLPSSDEVRQTRAMRILELNNRQNELALLKAMTVDRADGLSAEQQHLEKQKEEFEQRLQQLRAEVVDESTEQARGILLAMPPLAAVHNLMKLSLEENVVLLKGMPEKSTAKILQEFLKGDEQQMQRGQEIFEAISRGDPEIELIDEALEDLTP